MSVIVTSVIEFNMQPYHQQAEAETEGGATERRDEASSKWRCSGYERTQRWPTRGYDWADDWTAQSPSWHWWR